MSPPLRRPPCSNEWQVEHCARGSRKSSAGVAAQGEQRLDRRPRALARTLEDRAGARAHAEVGVLEDALGHGALLALAEQAALGLADHDQAALRIERELAQRVETHLGRELPLEGHAREPLDALARGRALEPDLELELVRRARALRAHVVGRGDGAEMLGPGRHREGDLGARVRADAVGVRLAFDHERAALAAQAGLRVAPAAPRLEPAELDEARALLAALEARREPVGPVVVHAVLALAHDEPQPRRAAHVHVDRVATAADDAAAPRELGVLEPAAERLAVDPPAPVVRRAVLEPPARVRPQVLGRRGGEVGHALGRLLRLHEGERVDRLLARFLREARVHRPRHERGHRARRVQAPGEPRERGRPARWHVAELPREQRVHGFLPPLAGEPETLEVGAVLPVVAARDPHDRLRLGLERTVAQRGEVLARPRALVLANGEADDLGRSREGLRTVSPRRHAEDATEPVAIRHAVSADARIEPVGDEEDAVRVRGQVARAEPARAAGVARGARAEDGWRRPQPHLAARVLALEREHFAASRVGAQEGSAVHLPSEAAGVDEDSRRPARAGERAARDDAGIVGVPLRDGNGLPRAPVGAPRARAVGREEPVVAAAHHPRRAAGGDLVVVVEGEEVAVGVELDLVGVAEVVRLDAEVRSIGLH